MNTDKILKRLLLVGVVCFLAGCGSGATRSQLVDYHKYFDSGDYASAAKSQIADLNPEFNDNALLETLLAGAALRFAGDYQQSNYLFDQSEEIIKHYNQQLMLGKLGTDSAALMVNDNALSYRGEEYDGIMVNTYKAINFWVEGKKDLARIEFNRALDRQRRAKERFAKEIAVQDQAIRQQSAKGEKETSGRVDYDKALMNPEVDKIIRQRYANLSAFAAYPDFVNPFTTYLAGLFFWSVGDYSKSATILKEAYGMMSDSNIVRNDFMAVEKVLDGRNNQEPKVWILYENGLGMIKEERRVDIPVWVFSDQLAYTGIALPYLTARSAAYPSLFIEVAGKVVGQTEFLASMDNIIKAEFDKDLPGIVSRAIVSVIIKTSTQYIVKKELGAAAEIFAAVYQAATTSADIRIWSSLPKEFQV